MPTQVSGDFTIDYNLFINAEDEDIQYGMDFELVNHKGFALTQLIFPATDVGNNRAGQWNLDNHKHPGGTDSIIFANAEHGTINDTPREISHRGSGRKSTKFAVYPVDLAKNTVYINGVTFGYSVDTNDANPVTIFSDLKPCKLSNEQKRILEAQCEYIKFS